MYKKSLLILLLFLSFCNLASAQKLNLSKILKPLNSAQFYEFAVSYGSTLVISKPAVDNNHNGSLAVFAIPIISVPIVGFLLKSEGSISRCLIGDAVGMVSFWLVGYKYIGFRMYENVKFEEFLIPLVFPSLCATIGYNIFNKKNKPDNHYSFSVNPVFYYDTCFGQYAGLSAIIRF